MGYIEFLESLKQNKTIIDYRVDGNDVYIYPVVPIERIQLNLVVSSDGDAMVSTGVDSSDGSTTGVVVKSKSN